MQKPRHNAVERRAAIVDAALPLFARKGFAGTTTKELAMAAGVSEALLYKHFPSKRAIYDEILSIGSRRAGTDFNRPAPARPSTLALIENIHFLMSWCFTGRPIRRERGYKGYFENMVRLVLNSLMEDGEFARSVFKNVLSGPLVGFEASFKAAKAAGDLVPQPLTGQNAFWFIQQVAFILAATRLPQKPVQAYTVKDAEVVRLAVVFALRGVGLKDNVIRTQYDPKGLNRRLSADRLSGLRAFTANRTTT
jgi:AcrR family transcriptional regulator